VAIEAPMHLLLKFSMMAMGILPLPGESDKKTNRNGLGIGVGWFQTVSTCLSFISVLAGARWIVEPISKETNSLIGKLTFVPIFCFRMLVWFFVIITLTSMSVLVFTLMALTTWISLICTKDEDYTHPGKHSLLSLIFPIPNLPSDEKNSKLKALFWMVITGNSVLIIVHSLIYCLYHFDMYNPWIYNCEENMLIIKEEVFKNINPLMISLFVGATVPVLLSRCLPSQR